LGHVLGSFHHPPPSTSVVWALLVPPRPPPPPLQTSPGSPRGIIPLGPNPELAFLSDVTKANHSLYRVRCRSRCPAMHAPVAPDLRRTPPSARTPHGCGSTNP
jgi:hypothetical protein